MVKIITVEAALSDLEKIEMQEVSDSVRVVRAIKVLVKFLSTIRSNQLLTESDKTRIKAEKEARVKKVEK